VLPLAVELVSLELDGVWLDGGVDGVWLDGGVDGVWLDGGFCVDGL